MGGHKTISGSDYPKPPIPPPPPSPDYHVEGDLIPDATCNYFLAGIHNAKPYYRRVDGSWFLWGVLLIDTWIISQALGVPGEYPWAREDADICGLYQPLGSSHGLAYVVVGGH